MAQQHPRPRRQRPTRSPPATSPPAPASSPPAPAPMTRSVPRRRQPASRRRRPSRPRPAPHPARVAPHAARRIWSSSTSARADAYARADRGRVISIESSSASVRACRAADHACARAGHGTAIVSGGARDRSAGRLRRRLYVRTRVWARACAVVGAGAGAHCWSSSDAADSASRGSCATCPEVRATDRHVSLTLHSLCGRGGRPSVRVRAAARRARRLRRGKRGDNRPRGGEAERSRNEARRAESLA